MRSSGLWRRVVAAEHLDAAGIREALATFAGRSVGGLVLSRGRDGAYRLDALEGATSVLLGDARGRWLADGVLQVRSGVSVETLLWDRGEPDAAGVVTRRVAAAMGGRRAGRRLAELEKRLVA